MFEASWGYHESEARGRQQEDGGRGQDVGAEIDLLATSGHPANIEIATGCGLDYVNSFKKFNFQ